MNVHLIIEYKYRICYSGQMARTTGSSGARTSEAVLAAALKLFSRHGYAAVSMRQIAGEVGLQAGALYNHFATKQSILRELMVSHLEGLIAAWEVRAKQYAANSAVQMLEQFVRFHISYHLDRQDEVFIAYMELRSLEEAPSRDVQALRQTYERVLRDILRLGAAEGEFAIADVPVTAMAIISMLTGVNNWFRYGGRLEVQEIEDIHVEMIMAVAGARQIHDNDRQEELV